MYIGACIQCSDKKCVSSCHPSCAYFSDDWQMITRFDDNDSEVLIREIYCPDHEKLASYLKNVADSKKAIMKREMDVRSVPWKKKSTISAIPSFLPGGIRVYS